MKKILVILCVALLLFGTCACAARKETTARASTTGATETENTVRKDVSVSESLSERISACVVEQEQGNYKNYDRFEEVHEILGAKEGDLEGKKTEKLITVYFFSLFGGFAKVGEEYEMTSMGVHPSAMVFEKKGEEYVFVTYWAPEVDKKMKAAVKAVFPEDIFAKIPLDGEQSDALFKKLGEELQTKVENEQ